MNDIEVSVVSGTYNRLESLKRMVTSVRRSVGDFHHYEIVLVDGGSTDGTIEWCKAQQDIVLIEQGELLGAVKAFNAGAEVANGRYVILANDDVYFIDESILRAISFMQNNRGVGIGCFYQNRNNKSWHVEQMPAIDPQGRQVSAWYGQVCIVPKWLGDKVGWWGNYLRTYGGDNELSCNVYEAGYHVMPIECACISDMMINDNLREMNGGDPTAASRQGVTHPDSAKWQKKWRHEDGSIGPNISTTPKFDMTLERKMRIMYMPLFEPGNTIQRLNKRGLRDALQKRGTVVQYDYMRDGLDAMFDYAAAWRPDLFVFQIQNVDPFYTHTIKALRQEHRNAIFVNWNGDYHPENFFDPGYVLMMAEMDIVGMVTTQMKEAYDQAGINWFYWQIGYEESDAVPDEDTPEYDVIYLGNCYSEARMRLGEFLVGLRNKGLRVGLYGSWPKGWASGENLYNFDEGQKLYRNSKLIISTQQYPDGTGFVSNRLFQALASGGGMVLQQKFEGMTELTGLEDGIHLHVWEDLHQLHAMITEYLDIEPYVNEIERVRRTGTQFVLENCSFDKRVDELFEQISKLEL